MKYLRFLFSFKLFESYPIWVMRLRIQGVIFFFFLETKKRIRKKLKSQSNWFHDFIDPFDIIILYIDIIFEFSRAVRGENFLYVSMGGCIVHLYLSQWAVYRIVAIDVRSRREGRDLRKVGFYDPIKNQTYLNIPVILYFLEQGAQPTGTVQDISKRAGVFLELSPTQQTKFN